MLCFLFNTSLLLRVRYKDELVLHKIASVAYASGHFGDQCDLARVKAEIETFSDFDIHQLCLTYESALGCYQLEASILYDSPKMQLLKVLLPQLQVRHTTCYCILRSNYCTR
jgi:SWI/SNF-related matrix-associated actin-dependent regulator 1 of chromatin subfamily A